MIKKFTGLLLCTLTLLLVNVACSYGLSEMEVEVQVLEEDGSPIEGVFVDIGFDKSGIVGGDSKLLKKITDGDGRVSVKEKTLFGAALRIKKNGYYASNLTLEPAPYVALVLFLRKIVNPIGLYAKKYNGKLPASHGEFGFDMEAGDWVAPNGQGVTPHIIFHSDFSGKSPIKFDGSLKMKFSNEKDGYKEIGRYLSPESLLKVEHEAPENGYGNEITWTRHRDIKKSIDETISTTGNSNPAGYFLRVNTVTNENGEILRSNYAKIYGGIEFSPFSRTLLFNYYYNSESNSRNLEFDLSKNKFGRLSSLDQVRVP